MKSLAASLALVSLLGACTAHNKGAGVLAGGALAAAGGILALSGQMNDCESLHYDDEWGNGTGCDIGSGLQTSMGVLAALAGLAVIIGVSSIPDADETRTVTIYPTGPVEPNWVPMVPVAPAPASPTVTVTTNVTVTMGDGTIDPQTIEIVRTLPVPAPRTGDPMLRQFTQQASVAARAGQCLAVRAIAVRVEDLDAGYRQDGFLRDPLVVACLN